jgi:hypothetical protein
MPDSWPFAQDGGVVFFVKHKLGDGIRIDFEHAVGAIRLGRFHTGTQGLSVPTCFFYPRRVGLVRANIWMCWLGAITWNTLTLILGLPTSSSHALMAAKEARPSLALDLRPSS